MAFRPELDRLLEQLENVVLLRELAGSDRPGVAIRHDIDHNLDAAVELAWREQQRGIRATYYILHDAAYMSDPARFQKVRLIQDFGHDVGLHTNFLAQWFQGAIDDVSTAVRNELLAFRDAGIAVGSVAAHGDPHCYTAQFTNYWLWAQLRPDSPRQRERAVNAEGRCVAQDPAARTIAYPETGHDLVRDDGKRFAFWSESLADHGLAFEASRVAVDQYYSDSGNRWWTGAPDPAAIASDQRVQILIHPEHWRAPGRHIYLLSTARSGSSWVSNLLENASTAASRHEFTLNYDGSADGPTSKRTTFVPDLQGNLTLVAELVAASRAYTEGLGNDCVEANVYLPHFLDLLPHPEDTEFVHLHRRPQDVVRSLLQRQWYEVPHDPKHPRMAVENWDELSQFEQICWYVREVNETLLSHCDRRLDFARMVSDATYLTEVFSELGVGVEPESMRPFYQRRRNETTHWDVPSDVDWPAAWLDSFARICGPLCEALGYPYAPASKPVNAKPVVVMRAQPAPPLLIASAANWLEPGRLAWMRSAGEVSEHGVKFDARHGDSAVLLLGGGFWRKSNIGFQSLDASTDLPACVARSFSATGWEAVALTIFALQMDLTVRSVDEGGLLRLFCLSFDAYGDLIEQKVIASIDPDTHRIALNFKPHRQAARFNLALFKSPGAGADLDICDFRLVASAEDRRAPSRAEEAVSVAEAPPPPAPVDVVHGVLPSPLPGGWNVERVDGPEGSGVSLIDTSRAGYLVLFNGAWAKRDGSMLSDGLAIDVRAGDCLAGQVSLSSAPAAPVSLFALFYGTDSRLMHKIRLGLFEPTQAVVAFRLAAVSDAAVALAVHLPPSTPPITFGQAVVDTYSPASEVGKFVRRAIGM